MCDKCIDLEKNIKSLEKKLSNAEQERGDVLDSIQEDVRALADAIVELKDIGIKTQEQVDRLDIVVFGSKDLNVRPMRDMLDDIYVAYSRAKWAAGAFGVTNLGTLIAFLSWLIGKGSP